MTAIRRFDHVGITVADLPLAVDFFLRLGLEHVGGPQPIEGEFIDVVTGIPGSRAEIVMLRAPGGDTCLELSTFHYPDLLPGQSDAMANQVGLRNVAFEVDDVPALVEQLATEGYGLVGGIGEYEGAWRMAYVRGPEGVVVSLAQRLA